MSYINGHKVLKVVIYNESQASIGIPPVDNLRVTNTLASWTAPNLTNLTQYNPVVSYIVKVNNTVVAETTTTNIDLSSYFVDGVNAVSVIVKVLLTNNAETTTNYSPAVTTLSTTLSVAICEMATGVVGNNVYLFGGRNAYSQRLNTILKFDTATETITTLSATLPATIYAMASGVVGNNVYLFGGYGSSGYLNTILKFDTTTETITTLSATLPASASAMASGVVGNNVYLFGGYNGNYLNYINRFDTTTETITTFTTLPASASAMASGVVGNNVYLFGGQKGFGNYLNTILKF